MKKILIVFTISILLSSNAFALEYDDGIWQFELGSSYEDIQLEVDESKGESVRTIHFPNSDIPSSMIVKRNNKKNGPMLYFTKEGILFRIVSYRDGIQHGKDIFKNKGMAKEVMYVDGKKHGIEKHYGKEDRLWKTIDYDQGRQVLNGADPTTYYDPEGKVESFRARGERLRAKRGIVREVSFDSAVTLDVKGMSIIDVLKFLGLRGGLELTMEDDVTGTVTTKFQNIKIQTVMDAFLITHGLAYKKDGNKVHVYPATDESDRIEAFKKKRKIAKIALVKDAPEKVTLNVQEMDINQIVKFYCLKGGLNIIGTSEAFSGKADEDVTDQPLDIVFYDFLKRHGFELYELDGLLMVNRDL